MDRVVYQMLQDSVSLDEARRKNGFHTLQRIQSDPSFIVILLNLFRNSTDPQTQFLAICCVRNCIGSLYPVLGEETREIIRMALIELLVKMDKNHPELIQVVRRVARIDFPSRWPQLVEFIIRFASQISTMSQEQLESYSNILYAVVKAQESKKLLADRKESQEVSPKILEALLPQWYSLIDRSPRRLDGSILRLCRIGFPRLHEQAFCQQLIPAIMDKLRRCGNENEKLWKEISILFSSQPHVIESTIGTVLLKDIAIEAIQHNRGREYPLTILRTCSSKNFDHQLINLVVERFLSLTEDDVTEWMSAPDESLGGPLDGDLRRQEAEMFLVDVDSSSRGLLEFVNMRIYEAFQSNRLDLVDAWLVVLSHLAAKMIVVNLIPGFFQHLSNRSKSPLYDLAIFRLVQVWKAASSHLSITDLEGVVGSLVRLAQSNINPCISLAIFFSLKKIYDRSHDHHMWQSAGPVMISLGVSLLPVARAPDTLWRLLNGITLVWSSASGANLVSVQRELVVTLFCQRDNLIRFAIIDLLKAQLVAADDVGEGPTSDLISSCIDVSAISVQLIVRSTSDPETAESLLSATSSLLTAILRVAPNAHPSVLNLVRLITQTVAPSNLTRELVECLVECNTITPKLSIDQVELCVSIIKQSSEVSDNVLDEVLVLLEIIDGLIPELVLKELALLIPRGEDDCPLPYDGVIQVVTTLAAQLPNSLRGCPEIAEIISVLWKKVTACRVPRIKLSLLNTLVHLLPLTMESWGDEAMALLGKISQLVPIVESECEGEMLRLSSMKTLRTNRFDSMPRPVRRDAFLATRRAVDVHDLKSRIQKYLR